MVYRHNGERDGANEPVIVSMKWVMHNFQMENGYMDGLGGSAADKLVKQVKQRMEECKEKHTEISHLPMKGSCDKWNPFLLCFEKAYGCN